MKQNPTIHFEKLESIVYEPVTPAPVNVAVLAPILMELLNQFRSARTDSNLPIIA